ncbi:MAG: Ig-like domain-containing protein [Gammaproteobacteria bacterium]
MIKTHQLQNIIFIIFIQLILASCGGGNKKIDQNVNISGASDKEPPYIVSTYPISEATGISPDTDIEVQFNEDIKIEKNSNVVITIPISGSSIKLPADAYQFDATTKKLYILTKKNLLKPATIYKVTISDIKDSSNNKMINSCSWIFATSGNSAPESIGVGKTGLCGTLVSPPNKPNNFQALSGNGKIFLSWDIPTKASQSSYRIEYLSDNQNNFKAINEVIAADTVAYIDKTVKSNINYQYRLIAINSIGESEPALSLPITPSSVIKPFKIFGPDLTGLNAGTIINFASSLALSPDGKTLAVGISGYQSTGKVQLFNKNSSGNWNNNPIFEVTSNTLSLSVAFSPDNKTLIINNSISLSLYQRDINGNWKKTPNTGTSSISSGKLSFSPDSKFLAVASGKNASGTNIPYTNGSVHLFRQNKLGQWNTNAVQIFGTSGSSSFGNAIAFSPDSKSIAIGLNLYTGIAPGNGEVYIYSRNQDDSWSTSPTTILTPDINSNSSGFGETISYSPDGKYLAIDAPQTYINQIGNAGNVHIYENDALGNWAPDAVKILQSKIPGSVHYFGYQLLFSPNSKKLLISDKNQLEATRVLTIFAIDSLGNWGAEPESTLIPNPSVTIHLSSVPILSADGNELLIGSKPIADIKKATTGLVNIYNTNLFFK